MNPKQFSQFSPAFASPNIKVLQVLPALGSGGVERGTVEIAFALQAEGMHPVIASSGGPMAERLLEAGIQHVTLPLASKNPITMIKNIFALRDLIVSERIDLVHARSRAPAWSAYLACKLAKVPLVTTFHGTYNFDEGYWGKWKKFYNSVMVRGDRVIAISHFIKDHIHSNYGLYLDPEKLTVIHRGVDLNLFDPKKVTQERMDVLKDRWRLPSYEHLLILPARLTKWKGQLTFVGALSILRKKGIHVTAVLMGHAQGRHEYLESLRYKMRNYHVEEFVVIDQACPDVPAAYRMAEVIVHASTDPEAFGRVIVEAQAMGTPVIASNLGAPLEIIESGLNGYLFESGDPKDLADKIETILNMDADRKKLLLKQALKNVKDRFTKDHMTTQTLNLYKDLLLEWNNK